MPLHLDRHERRPRGAPRLHGQLSTRLLLPDGLPDDDGSARERKRRYS